MPGGAHAEQHMDTAPLLTDEQIDFIHGPVSILVATHDTHLTPNQTRGFGCIVAADAKTLTVCVASSQAGALLADIRANAAIAVVFCRPSSDQALQVKADDAAIVTTTRDAILTAQRYREKMIEEIQPLGFTPEMLGAAFGIAASDVVAIRCTPHTVYEQTPGPNAGNAIAASGASH